ARLPRHARRLAQELPRDADRQGRAGARRRDARDHGGRVRSGLRPDPRARRRRLDRRGPRADGLARERPAGRAGRTGSPADVNDLRDLLRNLLGVGPLFELLVLWVGIYVVLRFMRGSLGLGILRGLLIAGFTLYLAAQI